MKNLIYTFALMLFATIASFAQEVKKEATETAKVNPASKSVAQPLYILDDVEMPSNDLGALKSEEIESVNVLKEPKQIEKCGEKGKNGVVIITTKKYKTKKSKSGQ
jgi:hypothetical protein